MEAYLGDCALVGSKSFLAQNKNKGHRGALGGDGYVCYLDGGDAVTGVCICTSSSNYTLNVCMQFFVYQLYCNKLVLKGHKESKKKKL